MVKFSISSHYRGINVHIRETFPVRYRARVCPSIVQKFIVNAKNHRALGRFDGSENRCSCRKKGGGKKDGEKEEACRVSARRVSAALLIIRRAKRRDLRQEGGGGRKGIINALPPPFGDFARTIPRDATITSEIDRHVVALQLFYAAFSARASSTTKLTSRVQTATVQSREIQ